MGIDNLDLCNYLSPKLSTVDLPKEQIGRECVKILFDIIKGFKKINRHVILNPTLVIRDSA